jgi:aminopeptidase N
MRWCSTNGSRPGAVDPRDTPARSRRWPAIPISPANPNRLRSLVGAFSVNQRAFHDASGRGYRFLADMILAADKLNPQTAAKLVPPLGRWRRFGEAGRADARRARADRRDAGLSKDVFEQASKSLA